MQKNIKTFPRVAEKAGFPYFKHDNPPAIDDFKLTLSGHIVIALPYNLAKILQFWMHSIDIPKVNRPF